MTEVLKSIQLADIALDAQSRVNWALERASAQVTDEQPLLVPDRNGGWWECRPAEASEHPPCMHKPRWQFGDSAMDELAWRRFVQIGGGWRLDLNSGQIEADPVAADLLALGVKGATWELLGTACHPDDRPALQMGLEQLIAGTFAALQVDIRLPKGAGWRWVRLRGRRWSPHVLVGSAMDVSELQLAKAATSADFHRQLFDAQKSFTSIFALDGRHLEISENCTVITGFEREEFLGVDGFQFLHPEDQPVAAQAFGALIAGANEAGPFEWRLRHKQGHWLWVEAFGRRASNALHGTVIIASHWIIDDRKRLSDELANQRTQLDQLVSKLAAQKEQVDNLFRALFHDLNSPLGSAAMGVTALRSPSSAEAEDGADIIDRSVSAMSEILSGVRLLYALDRGWIDARGPAVSHLDAAVTAAVTLIGERLTAKNLRLEIDRPSLVGMQVAGDEAILVHHVLVNVLTNAIKFSRVGGVIYLHAVDQDHGIVELKIRDEGVGMSPELTRTLFSDTGPTVRVGTTGERGSGFGLQLARAFLARYGGDLLIDSRDGATGGMQGTTVRLQLARSAEVKK